MGYKIENDVDLNVGRNKAQNAGFALVQMFSGLELSAINGEITFDENLCQEARFFSSSYEVMFYRHEGELKCRVLSDEGDSDMVDEEFELADRFKTLGNTVVIRKYLDRDEDGQVFVAATRLLDIKR